MRFVLVATVSIANPKAISAVLEKLVGHLGSFKEVSTEDADRKGKSEFLVQAEFEGQSAKDLNRSLLSASPKNEPACTQNGVRATPQIEILTTY